MPSHYTVDFSMDLRRDLSEVENAVLRYLIQAGCSLIAKELPEHALFQNGLPKYPYWHSYQNIHTGAFMSSIWERGQDIQGVYWGLSLRLLSLKQEDTYGDFLEFCNWFDTLSGSNGFVGSIWEEDNRELHALLFIYDGELYLNTNFSDDRGSVVTGQSLRRQLIKLRLSRFVDL